jgi:hypothetical protein
VETTSASSKRWLKDDVYDKIPNSAPDLNSLKADAETFLRLIEALAAIGNVANIDRIDDIESTFNGVTLDQLARFDGVDVSGTNKIDGIESKINKICDVVDGIKGTGHDCP